MAYKSRVGAYRLTQEKRLVQAGRGLRRVELSHLSYRQKKIEISCANGVELRDNDLTLAVWQFGMGSSKWTGRINSRLKPPQRSANRNIAHFRGL
jgi:hypothetical protein